MDFVEKRRQRLGDKKEISACPPLMIFVTLNNMISASDSDSAYNLILIIYYIYYYIIIFTSRFVELNHDYYNAFIVLDIRHVSGNPNLCYDSGNSLLIIELLSCLRFMSRFIIQ